MKTKIFNTRKIAGMALLSALAIVLLFIPGLRFPIIPLTPFLEYDACDIPIMFATFAYGPVSGLIVTFIVSVIQGVTVSSASGIYGILMHIFATGSFTLSAGFLFAFLKKKKLNQIAALAISTLVGSLCWVIIMIFANMAITPLFMKVPFNELMKLMLPAIIPFNLIKASANGIIGAILYIPLHKSVSKYLDKPVVTEEDLATEPNLLRDNILPETDKITELENTEATIINEIAESDCKSENITSEN